MKTIWFLLLASAASAAISANAISVSVEVEQFSSRSEYWRSVFGTYVGRETLNARVATANLRYFGNGSLPVRTEFFLIGQDHETRELVIYHYHARDGSIKSGEVTPCRTISPVIAAAREHVTRPDLGYLNIKDMLTGVIPFGWIVRVSDRSNGVQVVRIESSVPELTKRLDGLISKAGKPRLDNLHAAAEERWKSAQ